VALAIIVGNARRHRVIGVRAGSERHGEADKRAGGAERAGDAERAITIEGCMRCHRIVLVPPQSVIKP
jgi:hypothetical protein